MAVSALHRLAAAAPVPVFVARGAGAGLLGGELAADRRLRLVASPRQATVVLAAGHFGGGLGPALDRVHDQLPHPRALVWWRAAGGPEPGDDRPGALDHPAAVVHGPGGDVAQVLVDTHRRLLAGDQATAPDAGADEPPHPFEGRGDHGQGGEGMMGGVPFGRPMAMTGDDRDGLALGQVSADLGPFLVGLPAATVARVTFQGEVVQALELRPQAVPEAPVLDPVLARFDEARHRPVPVAELERARARHHLRAVAECFRLAGLWALAARAASLARGAGAGVAGVDPAAVAALGRRLRASALLASWSGVGTFPGRSPFTGGANARAAGLAADARRGDPAYRALGFAMVVQHGGDARARLVQRLAEARHALELASRAADVGAVHHPDHPLETPWGPAPDGGSVALEAVAAALTGADWSDALATLCSLDLVPDAAVAPAGAAP